MIEIKRYSDSEKNIWDEVVQKSKNGVFLFYRNYLDYHKEKFTDHSLLIYKESKIIAVFPANERGNEIFSHEGLTFGSLIMTLDSKAVEVIETLNLIKNYYSNLGFDKITYKVVPSVFHKYPSEEDLYALFRLNATLVRRDLSSVIKLKDKIKFSESKKQAVTKCENLEIQIIESQNFTEYWSLLTEVLAKFETKPVHSLEEIIRLKNFFPENIKLFEARKEGKLLAGIVIYDYGNVAHTQYMANSVEGRKIGALDYINQKLISEVYIEKEYYSFGISTENQGRELNTGLIQQKEMMGSRGIAIDFYEIQL